MQEILLSRPHKVPPLLRLLQEGSVRHLLHFRALQAGPRPESRGVQEDHRQVRVASRRQGVRFQSRYRGAEKARRRLARCPAVLMVRTVCVHV